MSHQLMPCWNIHSLFTAPANRAWSRSFCGRWSQPNTKNPANKHHKIQFVKMKQRMSRTFKCAWISQTTTLAPDCSHSCLTQLLSLYISIHWCIHIMTASKLCKYEATHTGRSQQLSVGERCRRLIGHILFLDTKQTYLESHFNFESQITITSGMLRVKPWVKTIANLKQQDNVKIKCHKSATVAVTR